MNIGDYGYVEFGYEMHRCRVIGVHKKLFGLITVYIVQLLGLDIILKRCLENIYPEQ